MGNKKHGNSMTPTPPPRPSRTSASSLTLLDPSETVPAPSRRPLARLESVDLELEQGLLEQQLNQPETSEDWPSTSFKETQIFSNTMDVPALCTMHKILVMGNSSSI